MSESKQKTVMLKVALDDGLLAWVRGRAEKLGMPCSGVIEAAVNKAMPKRPNSEDRNIYGVPCPGCGNRMGRQMDNYCPHCGQAIDWEEKE